MANASHNTRVLNTTSITPHSTLKETSDRFVFRSATPFRLHHSTSKWLALSLMSTQKLSSPCILFNSFAQLVLCCPLVMDTFNGNFSAISTRENKDDVQQPISSWEQLWLRALEVWCAKFLLRGLSSFGLCPVTSQQPFQLTTPVAHHLQRISRSYKHQSTR